MQPFRATPLALGAALVWGLVELVALSRARWGAAWRATRVRRG